MSPCYTIRGKGQRYVQALEYSTTCGTGKVPCELAFRTSKDHTHMTRFHHSATNPYLSRRQDWRVECKDYSSSICRFAKLGAALQPFD
jgi:hypothetical protein